VRTKSTIIWSIGSECFRAALMPGLIGVPWKTQVSRYFAKDRAFGLLTPALLDLCPDA
jgi:hypothetical protein